MRLLTLKDKRFHEEIMEKPRSKSTIDYTGMDVEGGNRKGAHTPGLKQGEGITQVSYL